MSIICYDRKIMTKERKIQILKNKIDYCRSKNVHKKLVKELLKKLDNI